MSPRQRTGSRRRPLLAALAAAVALVVVPATAHADPFFGFGPGAPADGADWPACALPTDQYCVESATLDGAPLPAGTTADVSILGSDPTMPSSINWALHGPRDDPLWSLDGVADAELVIRVGAFVPRYTTAVADGLTVTTTVDGTGNTTVTLSGRVAQVDWRLVGCTIGACGDATLAADIEGYAFSGNTQDLGGAGWDGDRARFTGMVIASNAQDKSTVVLYAAFPDKQWIYSVANPHLQVDGTTPATGSFTAYVPPNYFTESGIDPESSTLKVLRSDAGGDPFEIPATATLDDAGGVTLRVDSLSYSSPQLSVRSVAAHRVTVTRTGTGSGTVTSGASGIACGATCSGLFAEGDNVLLTARAAPGSVFRGWSGACAGASPTCLISALAGDEAVTARFAATPPKPLVQWTVRRPSHRVIASIAPVTGVRYRMTATRRGRSVSGTCTRHGGKVRCTAVLAPGWWTATVIATRDGVTSAPATRRIRA